MKTGLLAAAMFASLSSPASAADWWWIGLNGSAPNRVLTYVNRETVQAGRNGNVEAWAVAFGETALPNGQQHQATHYGFNCRQRRFATLGRIAYDSGGDALPLPNMPPTGYAPAAAGSIGESVMLVACGRPAGTEVHVDDPQAHAGAYFHGQYAGAPGARTPPEGGQAPGAPQEEEAEPAGVSLGTGFFVGPEGFAMTSYHVVDGADRIACRTGDGVNHEAVLERASPANDLALLRVDIRPVHFLGFAPRGSLRPGERVFTIGYGAPTFLGVNEPRFTEGAISALSGLNAEDAFVQISVPVQPGNSGGPLVNEAGQVVGIIASSAAADAFERMVGATPQSINWAVKSDYATPLMPPQPPAAPRTRAQAIALTHDAVCLIMAAHEGESGHDPGGKGPARPTH